MSVVRTFGAGNSAIQIAAELAQHADVNLAIRDPVRFLLQNIIGKDIHWWFDKLRLDGTNLCSDHGVPVIDDDTYKAKLNRMARSARKMFSGFHHTGVIWPDGERENVDTVIFATGFQPSLTFVENMVEGPRVDVPAGHRGRRTARCI